MITKKYLKEILLKDPKVLARALVVLNYYTVNAMAGETQNGFYYISKDPNNWYVKAGVSMARQVLKKKKLSDKQREVWTRIKDSDKGVAPIMKCFDFLYKKAAEKEDYMIDLWYNKILSKMNREDKKEINSWDVWRNNRSREEYIPPLIEEKSSE